MDKPKKLKRYNRKDYTQLVDFPVEIVGRDGVVRHYSFEASVRLYQRRIASASSRYQDNDVVDAEVQHCRRRIDQLRKSYFQRYGWSAIRNERGLTVLAGPLAGELAAFLRRFYGDSVHPENLAITLVQDQTDCQTYFVQVVNSDEKHLLYLYRFGDSGSGEAREAFFAYLRSLRGLRGDQVECLIAFHHTADCGLVLTGVGDVRAAQQSWDLREQEEEDAEAQQAELDADARPDPYAEGLRLVADGEPEAALARFESGLSSPPFRRPVALAATVIADRLGMPDRAEMAALMAVHYLPEDPVFHFHLGLSLVRQLRLDEARVALERSLAQGPNLFPALYLAGLLCARSRELSRADELFGRARANLRPDDAELRWGLKLALLSLRARSPLIGAGAALVLVGLALWVGGSVVGAVVLALGFGVLGVRAALGGVLLGLASDRRLRSLNLAPPESLGGGGPRLDEFLV